MKEVRIACC